MQCLCTVHDRFRVRLKHLGAILADDDAMVTDFGRVLIIDFVRAMSDGLAKFSYPAECGSGMETVAAAFYLNKKNNNNMKKKH